ncbi:hypothetical protein [Olleya namhaensis]|uniref:Uncharacterized protein n=1 Tax=Olleya namhaensis TaxID=1144750 RepID=A0A1I3Q986_9FLAO|nr:hypothetical protein [Olleya namhaensis]SFJ30834.1 hypothetical protein SAMN05443431_10653 [Olleya namhaensis]
MMKKNVLKYLLVLFASILTALSISILIGGLLIAIKKRSFDQTNDIIMLCLIAGLCLFFSFLANRNGNKYSIYIIIVHLISALISLGIESFDSSFTNDLAITNEWLKLFGWDEYDSGLESMAHRVLGFTVIIYPTILMICSLIIYKLYFKRNILNYFKN